MTLLGRRLAAAVLALGLMVAPVAAAATDAQGFYDYLARLYRDPRVEVLGSALVRPGRTAERTLFEVRVRRARTDQIEILRVDGTGRVVGRAVGRRR